MSDYDTRQCQLMDKLLQQYQSGDVTLGSLIASLEALLEALETVDDGWKKAFRRQWGVLETEYAVALDRDQDALTGESMERVRLAVEQIRCLLTERMNMRTCLPCADEQ